MLMSLGALRNLNCFHQFLVGSHTKKVTGDDCVCGTPKIERAEIIQAYRKAFSSGQTPSATVSD